MTQPTPDSGMVERVAREIEPNSWKVLGGGLADSLAHENRRTSSLRKARKILEAMREPTEAMLDTLHERIRILVDPAERTADIQNDRELWSLLIDAALHERAA